MKKINYILSVVLLFGATTTFAQDYHLSQYDQISLYMNPALTGMYGDNKGDYKIYNDVRSQWASIASPYTTIYLGYDMPTKWVGKQFGVGGFVIENRSPQGGFNTITVMPSIAYNITGSSNDKHYLTTGLQLGFFYKNFNPSAFTYDNQYNEADGGFDQSIPSGEIFAKTGLIRFDVNYGIYYKYIEEEKRLHPFLGFSIQHITTPNESFTSIKSKLPMRFNLSGGCDILINEQIKLTPMFLYMNQAAVPETDIGLMAYYKIKNSTFSTMLGGDYRFNDAIVIDIGLKQNQHIFRFSYDINTSYLNNFSGGRGAWEFSIILTGFKGQPFFSKTEPKF